MTLFSSSICSGSRKRLNFLEHDVHAVVHTVNAGFENTKGIGIIRIVFCAYRL